MRKSILLGSVVAFAAAALLAPTPILAADIAVEPEPVVVEDQSNWYISIHGGLKLGEDWEDETFDNYEIEFETDNGWRAGAAVGYSFSSIFAIEGEISYLRQNFDEATIEDCGPCLPGALLGDEFDLDGDASIWTGMVNLIAGFPLGTFVRPYVGGGIGFAHVSLDVGDIDPELDFDDDDVAFAAQGFAGIDLMLSENMAIGGRYRLLHIGDVEFSGDSDNDHEFGPDLIHSVEAVLTIGF
jgi:opacity protein-like surface antigen